jgi:hypothetical protein
MREYYKKQFTQNSLHTLEIHHDAGTAENIKKYTRRLHNRIVV